MHPAIGRLTRALDRFALVARGVDPTGPSRCAGWTNGDVIAHVEQVTARFSARAGGAWDAVDPDEEWTLGFGTFTAATCADINAFDALVHTWDIGGPPPADDDLVDAAITIAELLVWQTDHYDRPPAVAPATPFERLLVLTGRDPR